MTASRHQWSDPNRPSVYKTERVCLRCDLIKVTRHESGKHWIEWWADSERLQSERTPACVSVEFE